MNHDEKNLVVVSLTTYFADEVKSVIKSEVNLFLITVVVDPVARYSVGLKFYAINL